MSDLRAIAWLRSLSDEEWATLRLPFDAARIRDRATAMRGVPIAGDWDGDGDDNVGTYHRDRYLLDTDDNFGNGDLAVEFLEFGKGAEGIGEKSCVSVRSDKYR